MLHSPNAPNPSPMNHGSNRGENQKEKTNSTLSSHPLPRSRSTPKGKQHASHPTPSLQSPPATRGGMAHEEQNDPVAQSSMYQRRPPNLEASTADLSERDIKENLVVKEEETNDTEVFEEVVVEVARLSKEPKSLISPPTSMTRVAFKPTNASPTLCDMTLLVKVPRCY